MDELSLVMAPVVDGSTQSASLFDGNPLYNDDGAVAFSLIKCTKLQDDSLWIRYKVKN